MTETPEFATFEMVQDAGYGQDIPDEFKDSVEALIMKAERRLIKRVSSLRQRLADGRLDSITVADVVTDMVLRVIRNPDGFAAEQAEGFSYRTDWGAASGRLHVTKEDLLHLGIGAKTATVGTIRTHTPTWRLPSA